MNWLKKLFAGSENRAEKNSISSVTKHSQSEPTDQHKVKIYEKKQDGTLKETVGKEAMVGPIMELAIVKYRSVMSASRRNSIYNSDLDDLNECIGLLDKAIELWPEYGEPFGMRGDMYNIRGQVNRNPNYLDIAILDYESALRVGAKDISNHAIYKNSIEQVKMVKRML